MLDYTMYFLIKRPLLGYGDPAACKDPLDQAQSFYPMSTVLYGRNSWDEVFCVRKIAEYSLLEFLAFPGAYCRVGMPACVACVSTS